MTNIETPAADLSKAKLPFELTENEALIKEFPRSRVPYFFILFLMVSASSFFFLNFIDVATGGSNWLSDMLSLSADNAKQLAPILLFFTGSSVLGGLIALYVYYANRMFLTNEHVVRIKQDGLVATDKKVISHLNIEDIKARQNFVGSLLGYGLITMSTEGQNATYEINFIKKPFEQVTLATEVRDDYQQLVIDAGGKSIPLAEER